MANINPKNIENTPKSVFNENFKRQAMSLRGVPKDIIERIINGNKSISNKIDISFIIDSKKFTISLENEREKCFVAKIDKDDNIQQIFQDNFETNIDKNLVSVNIITTYLVTDGLVVEGVIRIDKPVLLFNGKIL